MTMQLSDHHGYPYDYAVFIGRMRPVTHAHLANVNHALTQAALVVVVIGSARQPRTPRTPFNEFEVEQMLRGNFTDAQNERILVVAMRDIYNNALWITGVRSLVKTVVAGCGPQGRKPRITVVGHFKDGRTGEYLKRFKPWSVSPVSDCGHISATFIRDDYWEDPVGAIQLHGDEIPRNVSLFMRDFAVTDQYRWLAEEHRAYVKDRKRHAPVDLMKRLEERKGDILASEALARLKDMTRFQPTFHAVDPVVVMDGHVLMIERGLRPGLGLLSLPGGFVNHDEDIQDAMLRSLFAKTKIKVPKRAILSRTSATQVFGYPYRSERGRIISTAFLVELDEDELPRVAAGTDKGAAKAMWVAIDDLDPCQIYEDHMRIIEVMLGFARKS